jgi:hypothetical protein
MGASRLKLLSTSHKWQKSDKAGLGYLTAGMYLSPYKISGRNFCPHASPGCIAACLNLSGRGVYGSVQKARLNRSRMFIDNRKAFIDKLFDEIASFVLKARRNSLKPAVRLNGTSDLAWETLAPSIFEDFAMVQFYDYTKSVRRMDKFIAGNMPANYHLTFSRSELNEADCISILSRGYNVAGVFHKMPADWYGFPVFDADKHDLRFLDPYGMGVLVPKGRARYDSTGFANGVRPKDSAGAMPSVLPVLSGVA